MTYCGQGSRLPGTQTGDSLRALAIDCALTNLTSVRGFSDVSLIDDGWFILPGTQTGDSLRTVATAQ
ncbi:hypothetical protein J6590_043602 [Homalodisca vitripennis]|nr:hypothetical protein J6590_043602 [Homalodisca vitripennis]